MAAEEARALMLQLAPEGFEETEDEQRIELAAYGDEGLERAIRAAFDEVESQPVDPNWDVRWKEFHQSITIGRLWIGPPWIDPPESGEAVVIDPGQAFGTGAHATTRLCLDLLHEVEPASLLDVGCGSGVLAIAAAKLGFAPIAAVDIDPLAIDASRENAERNGVELELGLLDALADPLPATQVVVANITARAVERLARRLASQTVIVSGFLASHGVSLPGYGLIEWRELDGWAAYLLERQA